MTDPKPITEAELKERERDVTGKRTLELWEILDGKLAEAEMWISNCAAVARGWRGGNHPRQEEFVRRWNDLQEKLMATREILATLAGDQQGAGFPRGQGTTPGSMTDK